MRGIILYGPPAVGKDTITEALSALDGQYALFPRIKYGPGRTIGYRMVTAQALDLLHANGDVIWENRRYGAAYIVDCPELIQRLNAGIPVLHLGQQEAISAVISATPSARWTVVDLYCARPIGIKRIMDRQTGDAEDRIFAWDKTPRLANAHISIDTGRTSPTDAARFIHRFQAANHQTT